MERIVAFDFSGTVIKPEAAEKANLKRFKLLGLPAPSDEEHKKMHGGKSHYDLLKERIGEVYGLTDEMKLEHVPSYGERMALPGKEAKTMIMTDLFRNASFEVAKEEGLSLYPEGMVEALQAIKEKGFKLAIFSGTRTDIITGMLEITGFPIKFDFVFGQDAVLSQDDKQAIIDDLSKHGKIEFVVGDKMDDLLPAKEVEAKSIFVTWGHPLGGEEDYADFVVKKAAELAEIIK
jgi:phosphoglycolate phosphatase-like HAD superfamily hydrolase